MMGWLAILFIAACSVFVYFGSLQEAREQREAADRMRRQQGARPAVPVAECARAYGEQIPPEVAGRVLRVLASVSEFSLSPPGATVEPGRLLPEDSLAEDLAYHMDSLAFCEMITRLEKEFGIRLRVRDLDEVPTVGDVIRWVTAGLEKTGSTALAPKGKEPELLQHPMRDQVLDG